MKRIMPYVGHLIFSLFMVGAFIFLISLSWSALSKIFPDSFVNQMFGLAMFDIAALAWLLAFIYVSQGFQQRSLSLVMFAVSMIGTIALVALEIAMSTGWLLYSEVTTPLSILLTVMVAGHVTAIYVMHIWSPDVSSKIETRADMDEIRAQAQRDSSAVLEALRPELARQIAADQVAAVKRELGFVPLVDGDVLGSLSAPEAHQERGAPRTQGAPAEPTGERKKHEQSTPLAFVPDTAAPDVAVDSFRRFDKDNIHWDGIS